MNQDMHQIKPSDLPRGVTLLKESFIKGLLSHAYLFLGEQIQCECWTGWFARLLLCEKNRPAVPVPEQTPSSVEPCGSCLSCRKVISGTHPDLKEVAQEGSGMIPIAAIREIKRQLWLKPFEAGRRVYIIAGADRMTEEAAQSTLKMLEEPPAHTVFLLTAPSPHGILPTILSRCQPIHLEGGWSEVQPPPSLQDLIRLLSLPQKPSPVEMMEMAGVVEKNKEERDPLLVSLVMWLRNLLMIKLDTSSALLTPGFSPEQLQDPGDIWTVPHLMKGINASLEARDQLRSFANPKLVFEHLLLELVELRHG